MDKVYSETYKAEVFPTFEVAIHVYKVGDQYFGIVSGPENAALFITPNFYNSIGATLRVIFNYLDPTYS